MLIIQLLYALIQPKKDSVIFQPRSHILIQMNQVMDN